MTTSAEIKNKWSYGSLPDMIQWYALEQVYI